MTGPINQTLSNLDIKLRLQVKGEDLIEVHSECFGWLSGEQTYAAASVFWTGLQDRVTVLLYDGGLWKRS